MSSNATQLKIAALLFLVTTTSFIIGNSLLESALISPAAFQTMRSQVLLGGLLEIVNSVGGFLIAVMLFGTLWQHSQIIALSYLGFRLIETILLSIGTANALLPLQLAGSPDLTTALGAARAWHGLSFSLAMIFLGIGSLMLCALMLRAKLVPAWLAVLGLLGYGLLITSVGLELIGAPENTLLFLPGALFEIVFPIWLFAKGLEQTSANPIRPARA